MAVIELNKFGNGYAMYNGVKLPALPIWDGETYPYAYIRDNTGYDHSYHLYITKNRAIHKGTFIDTNGGEHLHYRCASWSNSWAPAAASPNFAVGSDQYPCIWANIDIFDSSDNSVYLAASDPMFAVHYPSFLKGLEVGRQVAIYRASRLADVVDDTLPIQWNSLAIANNGVRAVPLSSDDSDDPTDPTRPIGYSYNGTILSALPEWDGEAYPYVICCQIMDQNFLNTYPGYTHSMIFLPKRVVRMDGSCMSMVTDNIGVGAVCMSAWVYDSVIQELTESEPMVMVMAPDNAYKVIWANHDIVYESGELDGSIWMAASDPIPVYGGDY